MLLRRVIEHVKAQNWTAVALDFFIVVVGVFIGIQVSNWNDARADKAAEQTMLRELRMGLAADVESIERALAHYRRVDERVGPLLTHMREGDAYAPALDRDFAVLYGFMPIEFNRAAYESLKSQGLNLISDDALRSRIARVYEQSYGKAQGSVDAELRVILDLLQPYYLTQFKDMRFHRSATPLDYNALANNPEFLNIMDYRLQIVRQNSIPVAEATLADVNALITAIDDETGALSAESE